MAGSVLEEEAALLAVDDDGIAVQEGTVSGRTEGTDFINVEKAPIRPENGTGLHITGGIKVRSDLDVQTIRHNQHFLPAGIMNTENLRLKT